MDPDHRNNTGRLVALIKEVDDIRSAKIVDPNFIVQAKSWMQNPTEALLGFIWTAYACMQADKPQIDSRDLERSITQLLEPRVRSSMSGFEPFYIQHGPFERETMMPPPAQPPEYDLAFVLRGNERIMWPIEAKVLKTPNAVASYVSDVTNQFLTCRYAPFSNSGAMLGYLLNGDADDAFVTIAQKLACTLDPVPGQVARKNRVSNHSRTVPAGKAYPAAFSCYHLILEYPGLTRTSVS
ncbi:MULTISPECIES: hypothetical protein [Pseudomonadota]|uniref:hypothetical protein n=1 Tax=Pseudomonadota TaxID=1224 RepID=UPI003A8EB3F5